jgi:hypothetical protein
MIIMDPNFKNFEKFIRNLIEVEDNPDQRKRGTVERTNNIE